MVNVSLPVQIKSGSLFVDKKRLQKQPMEFSTCAAGTVYRKLSLDTYQNPRDIYKLLITKDLALPYFFTAILNSMR